MGCLALPARPVLGVPTTLDFQCGDRGSPSQPGQAGHPPPGQVGKLLVRRSTGREGSLSFVVISQLGDMGKSEAVYELQVL